MNKEPYHQPLLTRHRLPRAVAAKTAGECALLLVLSEGMAAGVELTINKVGTNVVVSWPASATNLVLESSSSLATGWTAVTNALATNQQVVRVTLPVGRAQEFFRLKQIGKEPNDDKDPSEKDVDKDPNEKPPGEKDPNEKLPGEKDPNEKDPLADKDPNEKGDEGGGGF